jgi:hypothetical protein
VPVIEAGVLGLEYMLIDLAALVKQPVPDFTVIDPLAKLAGKFTTIELVP